MPVHCSLVEHALANVTRKYHKKRFPKDNYNYIELPDCSKYETVDGVHITFDEAKSYTSYFKNETKRFNNFNSYYTK